MAGTAVAITGIHTPPFSGRSYESEYIAHTSQPPLCPCRAAFAMLLNQLSTQQQYKAMGYTTIRFRESKMGWLIKTGSVSGNKMAASKTLKTFSYGKTGTVLPALHAEGDRVVLYLGPDDYATGFIAATVLQDAFKQT